VQNLVVASHAVGAHVGGPKMWGTLRDAAPLGWGMADPQKHGTPPHGLSYQISPL